ncbi:hypothetical protein DXG03_001964 [Asterophora parasitica]|uniref:Signal recognition particle subunit SRP68 n=1 Tax=Asterophora parasitica TaxID=117018 RepID=A0A9P7KDT7_9AGAR|nr:hypothetical protein DXG03_001964 [Asterophora parasitica]
MTDAETKPVVAFAALQLANGQRTAYGLRYNDFTRYRKHCANRTHRLRSTLKITHGKGREFKKLPPITKDIIQDGHLELLLLESERAWAHSQDLITQAEKPSNEEHASTLRHSATGRFRRAVHWATQFLSHSQALHALGRLSTAHLLQATVYTLVLNGRFLRYRDDFEDALGQLGVARGLLDVLAERAGTSREQALYVLWADEVGPEIRYCAHEMGREKAYDVDGIVSEVSQRWREELVQGSGKLLEQLKKESGGEEGRRRLRELEWEGKPVPVRNPELVDVLLRVQEAEARIDEKKDARSKKGVAAYDAILLALSDAEEVARKLVGAQQLSGSTSSASASAGAGGRDIQFVHAYIVYQLLSRRIQRDLLLIVVLLAVPNAPVKPSVATAKSKAKPETVDGRLYPALVKLLDTILQSLDQMRTLSIVDDNPDLASAVDARTSFTKARRGLFLARCYPPVKKYAEALTLLQHANIHVRETHSSLSLASVDPISTGTPAYYPLTTEEISKLEADIAADSTRSKREWFAHNGGAVDPDGQQAKKHEKALFFNIALNYVDLDLERLRVRAGKQPEVPQQQQTSAAVVEKEKKAVARAKVEEARAPTPEPPVPTKGGLSSLLGGWWGRS